MTARTTFSTVIIAALIVAGVATTYGCSSYWAWFALPILSLVATMIMVATFINDPGPPAALVTLSIVAAIVLVTTSVEPLVPRNEVGAYTPRRVAQALEERPRRRAYLVASLSDGTLDNREALRFFRRIEDESRRQIVDRLL